MNDLKLPRYSISVCTYEGAEQRAYLYVCKRERETGKLAERTNNEELYTVYQYTTGSVGLIVTRIWPNTLHVKYFCKCF